MFRLENYIFRKLAISEIQCNKLLIISCFENNHLPAIEAVIFISYVIYANKSCKQRFNFL